MVRMISAVENRKNRVRKFLENRLYLPKLADAKEVLHINVVLHDIADTFAAFSGLLFADLDYGPSSLHSNVDKKSKTRCYPCRRSQFQIKIRYLV